MTRLPFAAQGSRLQTAGQEPAVCVPAHVSVGGLEVTDAQHLLASLGFLLVPGPPQARGPAYLLVALRHAPTLSHFDPERIALWTATDGGPARINLEWPLGLSSGSYSWGTIEIIDRLGATNRFASFGGQISIARGRDMHTVLLRSDAPILSAGGHSDPADPVGTSVAAFFGVLRASVGDDQRIDMRVRSASPETLYSTYLARTIALHDSHPNGDLTGTRLLALLRRESARLRRDASVAQRDGESLAALIAAIPSIAPQEVDHG